MITSLIAGAGTFGWMLVFGIPYPALLGLLVIGSTIGGAIAIQLILEE